MALLLARAPAVHGDSIARALLELRLALGEEVVAVLKRFGDAFVEVLVEAAETSMGWTAARAVWEVAPTRAAQLSEEGYARGTTRPWMSETPAEHFHLLLEIVERHRNRPVPDNLHHWLRRKLYEPGADAEQVWSLLTRIERERR